MERKEHAGVPLRLSVLLSGCEDFLYTIKAGPAGGRLRRPSSAGNDTAATGEPAPPSNQEDEAATSI